MRQQNADGNVDRASLLEAILSSVEEGILVVDGAGELLHHNAAFQDIWGIPDHVLASGSDAAALSYVLSQLENPHVFLDKVGTLYNQPGERSRDEIRLRDGRILERTTAPVPDAEGQPLARVWVFRDITLRKRRTREEARREELERFAMAASHSLQTPLHNIIHYAQRADDPDAPSSQQREDLGFVRAQAHRMHAMVRGLARYAEAVGREITPQPLDTTDALQQAIQQTRPATVEQPAHVQILDEPRPVHGDATLVQTLLQEILTNAFTYHEAPPINVEIETTPRDEGWVLLQVRDNGIGIDPAYHERVFGLFERLHPDDAYPGAGVGLSIAQRIVERHDGAIWIDGHAGEGTTVSLTLPAATSESDRHAGRGSTVTELDQDAPVVGTA